MNDGETEATHGAEAFREEWSLFFAETFGKAGPIAIGVIAARSPGEALDAFIDAFVAPTMALTLGSRRRGLEEFVFVVSGVRFEYGKFLAACANAWATVFCVYAAVRVTGWTASGSASPVVPDCGHRAIGADFEILDRSRRRRVSVLSKRHSRRRAPVIETIKPPSSSSSSRRSTSEDDHLALAPDRIETSKINPKKRNSEPSI